MSVAPNSPSQNIENFLVQVIRASESGSDESQNDLWKLAFKFPKTYPTEMTPLFNKLTEFRTSQTYDPEITALAKAALNLVKSK